MMHQKAARKENSFLKFSLLVLFIFVCGNCIQAQEILLNGNWKVQLEQSPFGLYSIQLPGTLDDANIGNKVADTPALNITSLGHLTRKHTYTGKAYYSRTVSIPSNWKNQKITLSLGRVLWRSELSIDGVKIPVVNESLIAEHRYDLTGKLQPGKKHLLTICIDNSDLYPGINVAGKRYASEDSYEMAHAYTNHTQIKWNGILGYIKLKASPALTLEEAQIKPDWSNNTIAVDYKISNPNGEAYTINSYVLNPVSKKRWTNVITATRGADSSLHISLPIDKNAKYWNEFSPVVYQLVSVIQSKYGKDTLVSDFGLRNLTVQQGDLYLNSQRIFIRGNLECVIFPLTGYPPMKKSEWLILYKKAKDFGLNSFRFHSWCPPKAAFEAADEIGFYLQVELPHWNLTVGKDASTFNYLRSEAHRILNEYGNHPSFLFFSMGNELEGDFKQLNHLVHELKATDSRHLYTTTSFTFQSGISGVPEPEDEFFVTQWTKEGWVRGQGVFNTETPDFSKDFSAAAASIKIPLISHEIGQYSVYPDLSEIAQYTGNLVPNNFIAIRNDLRKKGLLYKAPAFLNASGKLATILYKEEVERAMKTKEFDGFQLLQLQDFPGQGTALVGLLNAFWQPKGFVTHAQFRLFNNPLTPLIRFPKAVYTNDEIFSATVELANFLQPLKEAGVEWAIRKEDGKILAKGNFDSKDYPVGNKLEVGTIQYALGAISEACRLSIEVKVKQTNARNNWNIWVYPARLKNNAGTIVVTGSYDTAMAALQSGKSVLLSPSTDTLRGIEGRFVPVFWSPVHFPDQPGTMGLLIDPQHKALQQFPTAEHTDWQWWDLVKRSKSLKLDALPDQSIIVRVIDNFVTNNNLGNLFEVKVGKGRLLFSGIDLLSDLNQRPQARQLQYSLLEYMKSSSFMPQREVSAEWIRSLMK